MMQAGICPEFWRKKKVLVTGHTGFKGSWLCLWLVRLGAHVTGVALPPPTKPSLFKVAGVDTLLDKSVMLDIRDRARLIRVVRQVRPQVIIHMAAQPLVRTSYLDPIGTYETNVIGTANILASVRAASTVRVLLNVTTDKCYENIERTKGYVESDPLGGYDPYSSSKACSELVTAAYRRSYFNPAEYSRHGVAIATARAGNVIGGGDWAQDRLIPDCIRSFMKDKDIVLRHPSAVRPWQHVLDPLYGYLMLCERLFNDGMNFSSAWNFGSQSRDVLTVRQVADMACALWGGRSRVKIATGKHPHEARLLMLNIAKVRKVLGWTPRLSARTALQLTVDWYKQWGRGQDMHRISMQQICDFEKKVSR